MLMPIGMLGNQVHESVTCCVMATTSTIAWSERNTIIEHPRWAMSQESNPTNGSGCEKISLRPVTNQHSEIRRLGRAVYPRSRFVAIHP